jgi:hypothetical protein
MGAAGFAALCLIAAAAPVVAQPSDDCGREAAAIRKAETQLPRLDVAPPDDKQIVCITLETNIVFARRLAAHVSQCPRSPHARSAGGWQRTGAQYAAQFNDRGCKPAIRGYRG